MEFKVMDIKLNNSELNFLVDSIGSKIAELKIDEKENIGLITQYRDLRNKLIEVIKKQIR